VICIGFGVGVRGLGWRGQTCVKNLPQVVGEVCAKFGRNWSVGSHVKEGHRYIGSNSLFQIKRLDYLYNRPKSKQVFSFGFGKSRYVIFSCWIVIFKHVLSENVIFLVIQDTYLYICIAGPKKPSLALEIEPECL